MCLEIVLNLIGNYSEIFVCKSRWKYANVYKIVLKINFQAFSFEGLYYEQIDWNAC